jgi:hypothetical protein
MIIYGYKSIINFLVTELNLRIVNSLPGVKNIAGGSVEAGKI